MIDIASEPLLTLTQATDKLPRRRRGKKIHVSTLYRWATNGCKGIVLETIQVGGTRCTSMEALQRFFEALTMARKTGSAESNPPVRRRTAAQRLRAAESAGLELERFGA